MAHAIQDNKFITDFFRRIKDNPDDFKIKLRFYAADVDGYAFEWRFETFEGVMFILLTEDKKISRYSCIDIETPSAMIYVDEHTLLFDIMRYLLDAMNVRYVPEITKPKKTPPVT